MMAGYKRLKLGRIFRAVAAVVLVVVAEMEIGNFAAAALTLLLVTFICWSKVGTARWLRIPLVCTWAAVVISVAYAALMVNGPQTAERQELVYRLYHLNCSAPFPAYRSPWSVILLARGAREEWPAIVMCDPWIK